MLIEEAVPALFYILFFFVPLVLFPYTSELFEFNKMVVIYILTTLIVACWLTRSVLVKRFIFRRTILDIPLVLFLVSQFFSFLVSIDQRTSLLGYYSRFNGGLLSTICYSLLYWAYVSNMDRVKTLSAIRYTLISSVLVSIYGVLEHLGIDKNLWVQDVQNRVFSTFGQPNWLAAWLVALLPTTWALALISNIKNQKVNMQIKDKKFLISLGLSFLFFITLLFTKSRSGLLGFIVADATFWGFVLFKYKKEFVKEFLIFNFSFLILALALGTPWTQLPTTPSGPALETGGTESGEIRKIVWKGAIEIWKHYPIWGTGPETFAYSYYNFRPVEHNLVSEWDFLYNKAHNEYLNYLANTGIVGLLTYLILIIFSIYQIIRIPNKYQFQINTNSKSKLEIGAHWYLLDIGLLSGYAGILVTNFFGFSVVPISLLSFLFPAMAIMLGKSEKRIADSSKNVTNFQKLIIVLILFAVSYTLYAISRYWFSDFLYAKAKALNGQNQFVSARQVASQAVSISSKEPVFWNELSQSDASIAVALFEQKENDKADQFAQLAIDESETSISLSSRNLNLKRSQAGLFIKLSEIDSRYLANAKDVLLAAVALAPTDAKIFYNLGLTYARLGETREAISTLEKTVEMKANYRDARLALAILFAKGGQKDKAREELVYILQNIDPNDSAAKQQLEELGR